MRATLLVFAVMVSAVACSKKSDAPAAPPPETTNPTPAATAPPSGQAAAPPVAEPTTAPPAGNAAPATGSGAAPTAGSAAEPAPPGDPRESELCPKVLEKIVACQKDKDFIAALDAGASAKQKQINKQLRKEIADWPDASCTNLPSAFEHGGFLYKWGTVVAAPDALESCAKLGEVLQRAGGLFGGEVAN